jgi:polyisoprenoid-binding protein YceI
MLATLLALLTPILSLSGEAPVRPAAAADSPRVVFIVAPEGNEARYRVREQLARLNFPNDAVGTTTGIRGQLVLGVDGAIDRNDSGFAIDLTTLETDNDRRDNFVRRNTFETADHPTATLVPTGFHDLPDPLSVLGSANFTLEADFVFKGASHPMLWDVTATFQDGEIRGSARTVLTFEQIELAKPRVGSVLSVADEIRLEFDFHLVRETTPSR